RQAPRPAWGGFRRKPGAGRSPPNNTEVQARKGPLRAEAFRQPPHLRAARKAAASRRRARDLPARSPKGSAKRMNQNVGDIVFTGFGACCFLGDSVDPVATQLRAGKGKPFTTWQPAVEYDGRC